MMTWEGFHQFTRKVERSPTCRTCTVAPSLLPGCLARTTSLPINSSRNSLPLVLAEMMITTILAQDGRANINMSCALIVTPTQDKLDRGTDCLPVLRDDQRAHQANFATKSKVLIPPRDPPGKQAASRISYTTIQMASLGEVVVKLTRYLSLMSGKI